MIFFFIPFFLPTVIHIVSNESNLPDWGGYLWKLALGWQSKELVRFLFFKKQTHAHKERERGWWGWLVNLAHQYHSKEYPTLSTTSLNLMSPFYLTTHICDLKFFFPLSLQDFSRGGFFIYWGKNIYISHEIN